MIGTQLLSASNTLDVIIESGDWERDAKLKQAAMRLKHTLDMADQLPELKEAYQATVNAYSAYIAQQPSEVKPL
jgi:hypothetical protein